MHGPVRFVHLIGKQVPQGVNFLGTAFLVAPDTLVTAAHVIGLEKKCLLYIQPMINSIDDYQDTTQTECYTSEISIAEIDPFRDIAILKFKEHTTQQQYPILDSIDSVRVGDRIDIFGFPHCLDGRRVLTHQVTTLGAKVLLETNSIKSKHGVVNFQSRPGLSGSPAVDQHGNIIGIVTGTYAPDASNPTIIAGINPTSLNQTTHIISAEYIKGML